MPPFAPDFSEHECVTEELCGEFRITCRCGHHEWHPTAEYADHAVEDHQAVKKRRRHAPLDRKARDKVLALAAPSADLPVGVLFSCKCEQRTWTGTEFIRTPILFRGSHKTIKRPCFICGGKKIREPEASSV